MGLRELTPCTLLLLVVAETTCGRPSQPSLSADATAAPRPAPAPVRSRQDIERRAPIVEVLQHFAREKAARNAPKRASMGALAGVYPPASWSVPAWYVSPLGHDTAACTDSAHPCRHISQIYVRWRTKAPQLMQPTQIFLLGDLDADDYVDISCTNTAGSGSDIELLGTGAATVVATGTLTTATNLNRSVPGPAGTLPTVTIAADASGFVGDQFVDTTAGAVAFVLQTSGAGHTVTLSATMQAQTYPSGPFVSPPLQVMLSPGDTYEIRRLVKANIANFGTANCLGYLQDVDARGFGGFFGLAVAPLFSASQAAAAIAATSAQFIDYENSVVAQGSILSGAAAVLGGTIEHGVNMAATDNEGITIDGDTAPLQGFTVNGGNFQYGTMRWPLLAGLVFFRGATIQAVASLYGPTDGMIWGDTGGFPGSVNNFGLWLYLGTASATLLNNPTLELGITAQAVGCAVDFDVNPAPWYCSRALTTAALDAPIGGIAGTGFAGIAFGASEGGIIASETAVFAPHTPAAYFNGGAGVTVHQDTPAAGQLTFTSP